VIKADFECCVPSLWMSLSTPALSAVIHPHSSSVLFLSLIFIAHCDWLSSSWSPCSATCGWGKKNHSFQCRRAQRETSNARQEQKDRRRRGTRHALSSPEPVIEEFALLCLFLICYSSLWFLPSLRLGTQNMTGNCVYDTGLPSNNCGGCTQTRPCNNGRQQLQRRGQS
jgi:hypothetical protein